MIMTMTEQDYTEQIRAEKNAGHYGKFVITFKTPVQLIHNRYRKKTYETVTVKLFFSGEMLCYSFFKRTGFPLFRQVHPDNIISIEKVPIVTEEEQRLKRAASLLRRIDKRCWDDIRARSAEQVSKEFADSNLIPFNFIKRFRPHIRQYLKQQMEDAFEHRKDFHYEQRGEKRDLKIETNVGKDGIFRAWFSSEYAGCANGDYYLVISPSQAIYYERD